MKFPEYKINFPTQKKNIYHGHTEILACRESSGTQLCCHHLKLMIWYCASFVTDIITDVIITVT